MRLPFEILALAGSATAVPPSYSGPTASIKNGTVNGVHSTHYNQDFFLGVPFAQPPVGALRFVNPQSINKTFGSPLQANAYAPECVGYGSDQWGYPISEDCLYLNVIRPSGYEGQSLPVGVWIHGGGFWEGGTRDERYNLSFVVNNSIAIQKPIIASQEVTGSGNTNMGLRDQRLALHWVQENIAAFGGDPTKVVIWGESAGAWSVGGQLIAYNGRDDNLFRGAIMESGNPISYQNFNGQGFYQPLYDNLVNVTGCNQAIDTLTCLRTIPYTKLNKAINTTTIHSWQPIVDGDFIQRYGSIQLSQGDFVHVPIIDGANSDEGTAFSAQHIATQQDFIAQATDPDFAIRLPAEFTSALLKAYPNTKDDWIPSVAEAGPNPFGPPFGAQYRRAAAYVGDATMIANRRATCEAWTRAGVPAYCYRFNTVPAGILPQIGATHFQEVAFVMDNTNGDGYNAGHGSVDPFQGKPQSYFQLARLMSSTWASFIHDLNPNGFQTRFAKAAAWPQYSLAKPQNIVWDANVSSLAFTEADTFRQQGIQFIMDHALAYDR